jgi:hypothetical protein
LKSPGCDEFHFVGDEPARCRVYKIHDVIKRRTQSVDVLPVKRGDEGLVQFRHYGTRYLVAFVLRRFDFRNSFFNFVKIPEKGNQLLGRFVDIVGLFVEKIVKLAIAWDELHAYSSSSPEMSPEILI